MIERIQGLETEYGLVAVDSHQNQALEAEAAARELFKPVVAWGKSSNVFIENGGRLYLDVGSHPEFATAECLDPWDIVAQARAGEILLQQLANRANEVFAEQQKDVKIHLFKNNSDSAGNSFGSHENYLVARRQDFNRLPRMLLPFLVTRQIVTGAGAILETKQGPQFGFSNRSDHMWEAVSSATTRARPIINTRDEPHADPNEFRRLHVISGDSNMSEISTWLRFAMTSAVLRFIEDGHSLEQVELKDPIRDIRTIARDLSATEPLELVDGAKASALEIQQKYLSALQNTYSDLDPKMLATWQKALDALKNKDFSAIDKELDWAIKLKLFSAVSERKKIALADPRLQRLDYAYHDINPAEGIFFALQKRHLAPAIMTADQLEHARYHAPENTRAHLRSKALKAALASSIDVTVDWSTIRLGSQGSLPVNILDPFETENPEVAAIIKVLAQHPKSETLNSKWKGMP